MLKIICHLKQQQVLLRLALVVTNIRSSAEMKIKSGSTYKVASSRCLNETFDPTYRVKYKALNEFDHDGDRRIMIGADDYARHKTGVNFSSQ